MVSQITNFFKKNEADIILTVGIILIALISFGGGWLLGSKSILAGKDVATVDNSDKIKIEEMVLPKEKTEEKVEEEAKEVEGAQEEPAIIQQQQTAQVNTSSASSARGADCKYVGSKNSNVYHLPECPGAKRIKEENIRCFASKEEAENTGYRPAKNCPGL